MVKRVTIKGKKYKIKRVAHSVLKKFLRNSEGFVFGACDFEGRTIYINKVLTGQGYDETLRHEMVHAFFKESGLDYEVDFARDEMLIDGIALTLPDMFKTCEEAKVLKDEYPEGDPNKEEKDKAKIVTTKIKNVKVMK